MIMEPGLPKPLHHAPHVVYLPGAPALQRSHDLLQGPAAPKCYKPMKMVWHHHNGQTRTIANLLLMLAFLKQDQSMSVLFEYWAPFITT
jgi:hypothetical protein